MNDCVSQQVEWFAIMTFVSPDLQSVSKEMQNGKRLLYVEADLFSTSLF